MLHTRARGEERTARTGGLRRSGMFSSSLRSAAPSCTRNKPPAPASSTMRRDLLMRWRVGTRWRGAVGGRQVVWEEARAEWGRGEGRYGEEERRQVGAHCNFS